MKKVIRLSVMLIALFCAFDTSFAAFPVLESPANADETTIIVTNDVDGQEAPQEATDSGEKSQLVALLLCLLVGTLGIHRFYLGYVGIGIIQLLTFGAFGIWTLIDLIMIITGDLKPKDGEYDKTL